VQRRLFASLNRTFYGIETCLSDIFIIFAARLNRTFYGIETLDGMEESLSLRVLIVPFMELKHQLTLVNRLWNLS